MSKTPQAHADDSNFNDLQNIADATAVAMNRIEALECPGCRFNLAEELRELLLMRIGEITEIRQEAMAAAGDSDDAGEDAPAVMGVGLH